MILGRIILIFKNDIVQFLRFFNTFTKISKVLNEVANEEENISKDD